MLTQDTGYCLEKSEGTQASETRPKGSGGIQFMSSERGYMHGPWGGICWSRATPTRCILRAPTAIEKAKVGVLQAIV